MQVDWAKIGTAGAAAVAVLGAVISEQVDGKAAAALWSLGMILAGVWLTQLVVDWWRSTRDGGNDDGE